MLVLEIAGGIILAILALWIGGTVIDALAFVALKRAAARNSSYRAMAAVERRRQGLIVGGAGVAALAFMFYAFAQA